MYIHIHTYTYINIYTYTCIYKHTCMCNYVYIYMYIHIYVCVYIYHNLDFNHACCSTASAMGGQHTLRQHTPLHPHTHTVVHDNSTVGDGWHVEYLYKCDGNTHITHTLYFNRSY